MSTSVLSSMHALFRSSVFGAEWAATGNTMNRFTTLRSGMKRKMCIFLLFVCAFWNA